MPEILEAVHMKSLEDVASRGHGNAVELRVHQVYVVPTLCPQTFL